MVRRKRGRNIFGSRGVIGRCRSVVLGCRGVVFCGSGVVSLSLVGDFSHKTFVAIGVIGDMLDTTIRQVDRVGSLHVACSVAALTSAEHSLGVVVSHGVVEGVRRDFISVCWFRVINRFCWCVVCRSSLVCWDSFNNRGVICRSCLYNRGMVSGCHFNHRSVVGRCWNMISRRWSMVGRSNFDNRGVVGWSRLVVGRGGWGVVGGGGCVVDRSWCVVAWGFVREDCRCKVCSRGLLAVAVPVDALR